MTKPRKAAFSAFIVLILEDRLACWLNMQNSKSAECEKYVDFANHCLALASATTNEESRIVLRQMAAEWLELAEQALNRQR